MQARVATEAVLERMPMVRDLVDNLRVAGFAFGAETMLFGVQHLMAQSLGLCWALDALGLHYDRIALAGKVYSTDRATLDALEALGVIVQRDREYDMRRSQNRELVDDVESLARRFDRRRAALLRPSVLVLDDGGQTLTRLQRFLPVPIIAGGVEQTASGFWQTGIRSVPISIVDVGTSAVKRICEPPIVIDAALRRVRERLASRPKDITVGIVGLGFIGLSLAKALTAEGYRLKIHDSRSDAAAPFRHAREARVLDVIDQSDVIFGCTGVDITRDLLEDIGQFGLTLRSREFISMSSGDDEFFTLKNQLLEERVGTTYAIGSISDIVGELGGSTFRVARNGFPINFDNTSESAPLEYIQGTICALIGALAQVHLLQRPLGHAQPADRIALDIDFQGWLLRRWRTWLPFELKVGSRALGTAPRRLALEELSTARTSPQSVVAAPAFGNWTGKGRAVRRP